MKTKTIIVTGKRKKAIARAVIKSGKGKVRINKINIDSIKPEMTRLRLKEPLILAGNIASQVDIDVNVSGGGFSGQADAARTAISNALVAFTNDDKLREIFVDYDRNLLVSDMRQREARKPNTHGNARGKVQKSYR
jgi:small subunit ribosomal protein S9